MMYLTLIELAGALVARGALKARWDDPEITPELSGLCAGFRCTPRMVRGVIVIEPKDTRSAQPACIAVALNHGQPASPSARMMFRASGFLMQVFEAGADDTDMGEHSAFPAHRIEDKGRVLLC